MDAIRALTARIRSARRDAPPRLRAAIDAGLQRLAIHPRQQLEGGHYIELCASYVHTMVDSCYETARKAWHLLRSCVGWKELTKDQAEERGIRIRPLMFGQRHGQHLLLPRGFSDALRDLAADLGIVEHTPDDHLDWRPVVPIQKGSGLVARCPFHDDLRPSMLLDDRTCCATCLACGTSHRLDPDGWRVSAPIDQRRAAPPPPPPAPPAVRGSEAGTNALSRKTSTIDTHGPCWAGSLGVRGRFMGPVELHLLATLEADDRRARRLTPEDMAQLSLQLPSDSYAHLDVIRPAWSKVDGVTHRSEQVVAERFVGVDVDGITPHQDDPDGELLPEVAEQLERWAWGQPFLSGRLALTQTSVYGVQVLFELAKVQGKGWRRSSEGQPVCDACDLATLQALSVAGYRGGHADTSIRAPGRLVRRPGFRIDKRGEPYVSRLRHVTQADADYLQREPSPSEVLELREEGQYRQMVHEMWTEEDR